RRAQRRLQAAYDVLRDALDRAAAGGDGAAALRAAAREAREAYHAAMRDDFNTAEAIAALFDLAHAVNTCIHRGEASGPGGAEALRAALAVFDEADAVLGIL